MALLHQHNWVHRDVSASNIIRDKKGRTRLGDLEYALNLDHRGEVHAVRTVIAALCVKVLSLIYLLLVGFSGLNADGSRS